MPGTPPSNDGSSEVPPPPTAPHETPVDETGSLGLVQEALVPLDPLALFVVDDLGNLEAMAQGPLRAHPEQILEVARGIPTWLAQRDFFALPRAACRARVPIVAQRVGLGSGRRGIVVAITSDWPEDFVPEEAWRAELSALCEMSWIAVRSWLVRLEQERAPVQRLEREVERLREQLRQTTERMEEAARVKDHFLTNMSHEIRTPLTAILGHAELLIEGPSEVERVEYARTIRRSSNHLLAIVNDLLDISRLEGGKVEILTAPTRVTEVLDGVMETYLGAAQRKGLDYSLEYRGKLPESIATDGARLRQILANLVGNAVKFTQEGGVWVVVSMVGGEQEPLPRMRFEVVDTGHGLTPEQQQLIFEPFNQADSSVTRAHQGTGLGLAIARHLTRLLGGELRVNSRRGHGSKFSFTIETGELEQAKWITPPDGRVRKPQRPAGSRAKLGGRVLLVEDGPDNQRLVSAILRRAGMEVTIAENGKLGSDEALAALELERPYDLILMDMQMPVLDGYQATARLRQLGYRRPIVALTAHALEGDRKKCLNAGCDDYMAKPIVLPKLLALVASYVQPKAA